MTNERKDPLKLTVGLLACSIIVFALGARLGPKPSLSWWFILSAFTSLFTLLGTLSGVILSCRWIGKCLRRSDAGIRRIIDIGLAILSVVAIPYCLLWFTAECAWLWHFGFTRDPMLLSLLVIGVGFIASLYAFYPTALEPTQNEDAAPERKCIALSVLCWMVICCTACCFVMPFLAMQGRRNWMIVAHPETFVRVQPLSSAIADDRPKVYPASQIAGTQTFPKVPPSKFLDSENAIYQKIDVSNNVHTIILSIECNCYSNNAFRIWAGRDLNNDDDLAIEETDMRFGWDAGDWMFDFVEDDYVQLHVPATSPDIRQRVQVHFEIDANGNCTHVGFEANGRPLATSGQLEKFKGVHVLNWNLLRIVRNGVPDPDELTSMTLFLR